MFYIQLLYKYGWIHFNERCLSSDISQSPKASFVKHKCQWAKNNALNQFSLGNICKSLDI